MGHDNLKVWSKLPPSTRGPRPCDWCGDPLTNTPDKVFIHIFCGKCGRACYSEEDRFYTQLGYTGDPDIKPPEGYNVLIPKKGRGRR